MNSFKAIFLLIILILCISLISVLIGSEGNNIIKEIRRTSSTITECYDNPVEYTEEICYFEDCMGKEIINNTLYCSGSGTICRNNTIIKIQTICSKTLYSGVVNYNNGTDIIPIDTTITNSSDPKYAYEMVKAPYKVYFESNLQTGEAVKFIKDNYYFIYDLSGGKIQWYEQPGDSTKTKSIGAMLSSTAQPKGNKMYFEEPFVYTNISYYIYNTMLKEEFNLTSMPTGGEGYLYLEYTGKILHSNNLTIWANGQNQTEKNFQTEGQIDFRDVNGNTIFYLPKSTATSINGSEGDAYYNIKVSGGTITFGLRVNKTFLDNTKFPVIIDPTITLQEANTDNINDVYVLNDTVTNAATNQNTETYLGTGMSTSVISENGYYRSYIMFNISDIGSDSTITDANLKLYASNTDRNLPSTNLNDLINFSAYNVYNNTWSESVITWDNQPCGKSFDNSGDESTAGCNLTASGWQLSVNGTNVWYSFNVTNTIEKSITKGLNNISIALKSNESNRGDAYGNVLFYSKEWVNDVNKRPKLEISYTRTGNIYNITSCAVIREPGTYYLTRDILNYPIKESEEECIYIRESNVTFDCLGHKVQGNNSKYTNYGIVGYKYTTHIKNITIRNCTISNWGVNIDFAYVNESIINNVTSHSSSYQDGLIFWQTNHNRIYNLQSYNNSRFGIYYLDDYNNFTNISLYNNTQDGIFMTGSQYSNFNNIYAYKNKGRGIYGIYTTNNFYNVKTYLNSNYGIELWGGAIGGSTIDCKNLESYSNLYGMSFYSTISSNITNVTIYNNTYGIRVGLNKGSEIWTLTNSSIYNNSVGIEFKTSKGNIDVYNNFFNQSINILTNTSIGNNTWNTSKRLGTREFSDGIYISGNYWAHPNSSGYSETCTDSDYDGFCDSPYSININNTDYLPLSNKYGRVHLIEPTDNTYLWYYNKPFMFNFTVTLNALNITNASLYGNWSGTWKLNKTNITRVNTGIKYNFTKINISRGGPYIWNIQVCNASATYKCYFADNNRTFWINNSKPNITSFPESQINNTGPNQNMDLQCDNGSLSDLDTEDTLSLYYDWLNGTDGTTFNSTGINSKVLLGGNISVLNSYWKCRIWLNDTYDISINYTSKSVKIAAIGADPIYPPTIGIPNATTNITGRLSNTAYPTFNNTWLNLTINYTDLDTYSENITARFCKGGATPTSQYCHNIGFCNTSIINYVAEATKKGRLSCRLNTTGLTSSSYTYYVIVTDNNSLYSYSSEKTFHINHPPGIITLTNANSDPDNAITYTTVNNITFNWISAIPSDSDGDSLNYSLYADTNTNPTTLIYNGTSTSKVWKHISDATYYWKIIAVDEHGYSSLNHSNIRSFTIDYVAEPLPEVGGGEGEGEEELRRELFALQEALLNVSVCGNGICENDESYFQMPRFVYCPEDCGFTGFIENVICFPWKEGCKWKEAWFLNIIVWISGGSVLLFFGYREIQEKTGRRPFRIKKFKLKKMLRDFRK